VQTAQWSWASPRHGPNENYSPVVLLSTTLQLMIVLFLLMIMLFLSMIMLMIFLLMIFLLIMLMLFLLNRTLFFKKNIFILLWVSFHLQNRASSFVETALMILSTNNTLFLLVLTKDLNSQYISSFLYCTRVNVETL